MECETRRGTVRYLAYGSNLHPLRLTERVPSASLLGMVHLQGWTMRFQKRGEDGSAKCGIARGEGLAHGAVYEMCETHLPRLDQAEGPGYRREVLEVSSYGSCFVYLPMESHLDPLLRPFSWYRELVLAGGEFLEFPGSYLAEIARVETDQDSDPERHSRHMRIVHRARAGEIAG